MTRLKRLDGVGIAAGGLVVVLACALVGQAAAGVGSQRTEMRLASDARNTRTVIDDFGRNVTVRYPPLRIVSLAPGANAMLRAAGASNQLIGTIEYSGQPASEKRLVRIGSPEAIDMERLIASRPDVVVVWPDGNNPAQIATIERLGIPVYRQEAVTLDAIGASLRRLGRLAGTSLVADREASALEAKLAVLRKQYASGGHPPSVLLEVWDRPLYTVGGRELMSDSLRACGARNVFADLPERAPAIGVEAVLARNPDLIIAVAPPGKAASWLAQWKRFPSLRAVRSGRLMAFEDERLQGLGPGVVDATAAMCREIAVLTGRTASR